MGMRDVDWEIISTSQKLFQKCWHLCILVSSLACNDVNREILVIKLGRHGDRPGVVVVRDIDTILCRKYIVTLIILCTTIWLK